MLCLDLVQSVVQVVNNAGEARNLAHVADWGNVRLYLVRVVQELVTNVVAYSQLKHTFSDAITELLVLAEP
jgi:hypothetical protein